MYYAHLKYSKKKSKPFKTEEEAIKYLMKNGSGYITVHLPKNNEEKRILGKRNC